jgi:hypothetical protein
MLITGDAIHCQNETARLVAERGGEWLFALKANRPVMQADIAACFADPKAASFETHTTTDADHGRIETRRHVVCHEVNWLFSQRHYPDEPRLSGLATLAMVEATIERDGRTSIARRFMSRRPG